MLGMYGESEVTDVGMSQVAQFSDLQSLAIRGQFSVEAISRLSKCPGLRRLVVGSERIDDSVFENFESLAATFVCFRPECQVTRAGVRRYLEGSSKNQTIIADGRYFLKDGSLVTEELLSVERPGIE